MDPAANNLTPYRPGTLAPTTGSGSGSGGANLLDVLDRVLDKGVVIAGDIRINLLDIELLTIKVRLLISSADKAKEMGIDWWTRDPHLSSNAQGNKGKQLDADGENKALRERIERLEGQLKALTAQPGSRAGGQSEAAAAQRPAHAGAGRPTGRRG